MHEWTLIYTFRNHAAKQGWSIFRFLLAASAKMYFNGKGFVELGQNNYFTLILEIKYEKYTWMFDQGRVTEVFFLPRFTHNYEKMHEYNTMNILTV